MRPLEESELRDIARDYQIEYDTVAGSISFANDTTVPSVSGQHFIETRMARSFAEPRSKLFARIADLQDHTRLFSHLTALNVISSKAVAQVIGENQFIIVEGLAEGGSKLGVKLMTLFPPAKIECELFTDLFRSAVRAGPLRTDPKIGAIFWEFHEESPNTTVMQIRSRFQVGETTAYIRGTIDHVWLDFFENLMIDMGELQRKDKRCAPFPNQTAESRRVA